MPADAQIVVTTPDRNILWGHRCLREVLGKGVGISPAIHSLKHTVGVVLFLLHDLVSEKLVITKDLASCRSRNRDRNNSTQISSWLVFIFLMLILSFLILFPCIHLFVQQMSYWFFNSFFFCCLIWYVLMLCMCTCSGMFMSWCIMEFREQPQASVSLPPLFERGSLVHCGMQQTSWPFHFWGFSCLCLPPLSRDMLRLSALVLHLLGHGLWVLKLGLLLCLHSKHFTHRATSPALAHTNSLFHSAVPLLTHRFSQAFHSAWPHLSFQS